MAREGQWGLELSLEGGGPDFVRAYAKSARIPVRPGQLVRLSARVNVPEDLKDTHRGTLIGLSRFRQGKCIATWSGCEFGQAQATKGWKLLSVQLFVDEKPCDEVEAIIGLCGSGRVCVDAVELVTLSKPAD
jgi:hypothetical protein